MFEVNFDNDEILDIEKNVKNSNIKNNKSSFIKSLIISLGLGIGTFAGLYSYFTLDTLLLYSLGVSGITLSGSMVYDFVKSGAIKIIRKQAYKNLDKVADLCNDNGILSNSEDISKSVIIKNKYKDTKDNNVDGEVQSISTTKNETYYLFLDDNDVVQGLLESNIVNDVNGNINSSFDYYILEKDDIESLESKVCKVKRLVRSK